MWIETGDGGRKWEADPNWAIGTALLIVAIVTAPLWAVPVWIKSRIDYRRVRKTSGYVPLPKG